jgi:hypothetical protein
MTRTTFTLEEAEEIADDFEDLADTEFTFDKKTTWFVDNIMVGPFDDSDRDQFVKNYLSTKDKVYSLSLYAGDFYDVLLVAFDVNDDTNYICMDIRSFATQKGISYAFP